MKKNSMGYILTKKIALLALLVSAALFSTSFAGRISKSMQLKDVQIIQEDLGYVEELHHEEEEEAREIHKRMLRVKTGDYGRYDPAPAMVKPPFKLIPN